MCKNTQPMLNKYTILSCKNDQVPRVKVPERQSANKRHDITNLI